MPRDLSLKSRPQVLAFLEAIKDAPEDDTPRLVLAARSLSGGKKGSHGRGCGRWRIVLGYAVGANSICTTILSTSGV